MKFVGCLLTLSLAAASQQPGEDRRVAVDQAELSRLENIWNEAHVKGDAEALDQLWADDIMVTVPSMPIMTKAESIGVWRSGRMKFQRYQTSDVRIRVYGDAAVVTGRLQRARVLNGRDVDEDWRFSKVYVRRAGQWRVVDWHASPTGQQ